MNLDKVNSTALAAVGHSSELLGRIAETNLIKSLFYLKPR